MKSESSSISLLGDSVVNNLNFISSCLNPETRLCAVVKGNAYGHGLEQFATLLLKHGVNCFAVYSADEAFRLKQILPLQATLIIMGDTGFDSLEWCIRNNVEFFAFNFERLNEATRLARKVRKKALVHLELETGMYRTGFEHSELNALAGYLHVRSNEIKISGICTHFAGAELIANMPRVREQANRFNKMVVELESNGIHCNNLHACCSAALIRIPEMRLNMVRTGILLYGFWPSAEMAAEYTAKNPQNPNPLRRVMRWQSRVMSIKEVPAGEWVGYGETYLAYQNIRTAVVPVGYAHGYARSLSNQGMVIIGGIKLPVLGTINMNCLVVDITPATDVKPGDEVILIGHQGDQEISVASFAERSEQLNYEMLTRLPHAIPRIIID